MGGTTQVESGARIVWCAAIFAGVMLLAVTPVRAQLSTTFYAKTCPNLMTIMRNAMNEAGDNDPTNFPGILRLFAHDAFVNGVDGSILLDTVAGRPKAEKDAPASQGLFGYDAIENAKFELEQSCPGVVSCADILTLSAQLIVEMTGGPIYQSPLGRRDSTKSLLTDANAQVPTAVMSLDKLKANFASRGLTQDDLVALSGAHTIGFAHCASFSYRIYNWNATQQFDPSMDPTLADQLRDVCPQSNADASIQQPLDISSINNFDEKYYFNLGISEGILQSDQLIGDHPSTAPLVTSFANNRKAFFNKFVSSMLKFANWNVLTGTKGEIRKSCNLRN